MLEAIQRAVSSLRNRIRCHLGVSLLVMGRIYTYNSYSHSETRLPQTSVWHEQIQQVHRRAFRG